MIESHFRFEIRVDHYLTSLIYLRRMIMKLSAPKVITFWIAVALAVLGLIGALFTVNFLTDNAFWFVLVGFIVLAVANLTKGI
jgi:hypothetical protein